MNKEEILQASRREHQNKDLYSLEVTNKAQRAGGLTALFIAFSLMAAEVILFDNDVNYSYFLIILSAAAGGWNYKAVKMRKKSDIFLSIIWTLLTIYAAAMVVSYFIR